MQIRKRIVFSGRVQGVGFRWTAVRLARPLGLTGWVENLWDGRVEIEAQGEDWAIRWLLAGLADSPRIVIESMETENLTPREESGFQIKGC